VKIDPINIAARILFTALRQLDALEKAAPNIILTRGRRSI